MQLFSMDTSSKINIKQQIKHIRFRDVVINQAAGRERDIEEMIIRYPGLLNLGDFNLDDQSNIELLIITRQPTTAMKKRADLMAIDREGNLVVIEVKRDAIDERNRIEGMEFQSIRYAAASRKMTIDAVIDTFTRYLQSISKEVAPSDQADEFWRRRAVLRLCIHLADEDEELLEDQLEERIDPRKKQKIYLVAADYEPDVISACAWLRDHNIDISCFRLRPYRIANQIVLERERLIPPPELDDYMTDTFTTNAQSVPTQTNPRVRARSNKPVNLVWFDDLENSVSVKSWRGLLEHVVRRALEWDLDPESLPMRKCSGDSQEEIDALNSPVLLPNNIYVDLLGNANQIQDYVRRILRTLHKEGSLRIETMNGDVITI